jgi:hypothetical protein
MNKEADRQEHMGNLAGDAINAMDELYCLLRSYGCSMEKLTPEKSMEAMAKSHQELRKKEQQMSIPELAIYVRFYADLLYNQLNTFKI